MQSPFAFVFALVLVIETLDHQQAPDYEGSETGGTSGDATNALFKRALRRFAAFLWMMPRLAALSIAEIIAWTSFASGFDAVLEMPFCIFRRRVSTLRLRRERKVV
jgi:hypothetical protein